MSLFIRAILAGSISIPLVLVAPNTQAQNSLEYVALSEHLKSIQVAISQLPGVDKSTDTVSQIHLILASFDSTKVQNAQPNRRMVNQNFNRAVNAVDQNVGPDAAAALQKAGRRANRRLVELFGNAKAARIEKEFFKLIRKNFISPS